MRRLPVLLLFVSPIFAQQLPEEVFIDQNESNSAGYGENLARVTFADKYTYLTNEHHREESALRNMPVVSGDFLETRHQSYAELEFIDGSLMQLGDGTKAEFQAINEVYKNESLSVVKLFKGRVFLHVTDEWYGAENRIFRVDTASGSAYIEVPGIYFVEFEGSRMTLKVYRGFAELSGEQDSSAIQSGEYATIRNMYRPTRARPFNSFHGDRFERWAYERRPAGESVSSKYVDARISRYSRDLDDYGEWRYESDLDNYVWVPYVSTGWRPYWNGYWAPSSSNLTWISYDSFGWITHHYGRWGWNLGLGWYWIPGYRYSPGWVAWTTYNTYVGWCPLGYYDRPYYYSYDRPNVTIINNHHNRWNYVSSTTIIHRTRTYTQRNIAVRGTRRITTRNIHITRDDYQDHRRLASVIRDPKINRSRDRSARPTRKGTLYTGRNQDNSSNRVQIRSRNTGTRAVARHIPERANSRNRRDTKDGSDIFRENTRLRNAQDANTRRYNGQTERQQPTRGVSRSGTSSRGSETKRDPVARPDTQRNSSSRTTGRPQRVTPNRNPPSVERSRGSSTSRSTPRASEPKRDNSSRPTRTSPPKRDNNNGSSSRLNRSSSSRNQSSRSSNYGTSERKSNNYAPNPTPRSQRVTPSSSRSGSSYRSKPKSSSSRPSATRRTQSASRPRSTTPRSSTRTAPRSAPRPSSRASSPPRTSSPRPRATTPSRPRTSKPASTPKRNSSTTRQSTSPTRKRN